MKIETIFFARIEDARFFFFFIIINLILFQISDKLFTLVGTKYTFLCCNGMKAEMTKFSSTIFKYVNDTITQISITLIVIATDIKQ